ncbi:hypothetical protein Btru_059528 [Bulinus truncatus]|nr:hypothetical protein Btru_059528 [Bulinus truncatus]
MHPPWPVFLRRQELLHKMINSKRRPDPRMPRSRETMSKASVNDEERGIKRKKKYRRWSSSNSKVKKRGRQPEEDEVPLSRHNIRAYRIGVLSETYSPSSNLDLDEYGYLDDEFFADISDMSSKEGKGKAKKKGKKKGKGKGSKGKAEAEALEAGSPELADVSELPKVGESNEEIKKQLSGSIKSFHGLDKKPESVLSLLRTNIRSKPSLNKAATFPSTSQVPVHSNSRTRESFTGKPFERAQKVTADFGCSVPSDITFKILEATTQTSFLCNKPYEASNHTFFPGSKSNDAPGPQVLPAGSQLYEGAVQKSLHGSQLFHGSPHKVLSGLQPSSTQNVVYSNKPYEANAPGTAQREVHQEKPPSTTCIFIDDRSKQHLYPQFKAVACAGSGKGQAVDNDYNYTDTMATFPGKQDVYQDNVQGYDNGIPNQANKYICYKINTPSELGLFQEAIGQDKKQTGRPAVEQPTSTYPYPNQSQWLAADTFDPVDCVQMCNSRYARKSFRNMMTSTSETNATKKSIIVSPAVSPVCRPDSPNPCALRERSERNKSMDTRRLNRRNDSQEKIYEVGVSSSTKRFGRQMDSLEKSHEVGASKSCDSVKSLKEWNVLVARDFEHLLSLYQNFQSMSSRWKYCDDADIVKNVSRMKQPDKEDLNDVENSDAYVMDVLDEQVSHLIDAPVEKHVQELTTDDESHTMAESEDPSKLGEGKLNRSIHTSVEYLKFYRYFSAAKAASEAGIRVPGVDDKGYVDDDFVDYLQVHREFSVRKMINLCGIQLVTVDEDILCNLRNYLQLYSEYAATKKGSAVGYKDVELYQHVENTFRSYVHMFYIFSAAKLLSEEGQAIPGVDKQGFLDDDFLDYLQKCREFSVRKVINDCSFSSPSAFIVSHVTHYIKEYLRLYEEFQQLKQPRKDNDQHPMAYKQMPSNVAPATVYSSGANAGKYTTSRDSQRRNTSAAHDVAPRAAEQYDIYGATSKTGQQPLLHCPTMTISQDAQRKLLNCSSQVEDLDLFVLDEMNKPHQTQTYKHYEMLFLHTSIILSSHLPPMSYKNFNVITVFRIHTILLKSKCETWCGMKRKTLCANGSNKKKNKMKHQGSDNKYHSNVERPNPGLERKIQVCTWTIELILTSPGSLSKQNWST